MRTRFIVGNWKMNKTASEAAAFIQRLQQELPDIEEFKSGSRRRSQPCRPHVTPSLPARRFSLEPKTYIGKTREPSPAKSQALCSRTSAVSSSWSVILNAASTLGTRMPGRTEKCWRPFDMDSSRFSAWAKRCRSVIPIRPGPSLNDSCVPDSRESMAQVGCRHDRL